MVTIYYVTIAGFCVKRNNEGKTGMDNILDYVKWYGEFSFKEKPVTEVDNFVFCKLAYLLLDGISIKEKRTFRNIVDELKKNGGIKGTFYGNEIIVDEAAKSKRFGDVVISDYEDVYNHEISAQFSAMTFDLTDTDRFVAYRGTDDTMAGWKEDFMISFTETEAQKLALKYLERNVDDDHRIYVAGHSKGANLALYAAIHLDTKKQERLAHIYMNDGPGLCPEVCNISLIENIKEKTTRFLPEYSIFGKLFEPVEIPAKILESTNEGVMQHDLFSWGVDHGVPLLASGFASGSVFINQVLDQWIESVNNARRTAFVNSLFDAIDKSGIKTTTQIVERGPFAVEKILIEFLALDKKTVRTLMKLPMTAALDRAPDPQKAMSIKRGIKKMEWMPYVGMILASIVLFIIPEYTLQLAISTILLAGILFEVGVTLKHLIKAKFDLQQESARVYICLLMIGVYALLLVKEDALFFIGSVVIGVAFLSWAYRNAINYKNLCNTTEKKERKPEKIKLIIEIIFLIVLGGFILVAPKDTLSWYMCVLGSVFLIDGVVNIGFIIDRIVKNKKN